MGHRVGFEVPCPLCAFGDTPDPLLCFLGCPKSPCVPQTPPVAFQDSPAPAPSDCSLPAHPECPEQARVRGGHSPQVRECIECPTPLIHFIPLQGERNERLYFELGVNLQSKSFQQWSETNSDSSVNTGSVLVPGFAETLATDFSPKI